MKRILFSLFAFLIIVPTVYAAPATLSLDPVEIKTAKDQTFRVNINIFTGNEAVASTDVVIKYDPTAVEPLTSQTVNGDLFQSVDAKIINPGKLYLYGIDKQKSEMEPARGTVATLTFKALKEGSSQLQFDCEQYKDNTSQIIKMNSNLQNIINCTSTITHTTTVSTGSSSVLGAFSGYEGLNPFTLLLGSVVIIFTCYIIAKYQRLHKDIS